MLALGACALVTAAALPFATRLDHANIVMVYLLGVAVVALRLGRAPAVTAAVASVVLFDFFFVEPRFSFAVADAQYVITFGVMFAVALLVGSLTARLKSEAERATERESRTRALYGIARELTGAHDVRGVADAVRRFLGTELGVEAEILVPGDDGRLRRDGGDATPCDDEVAVAQRAYELGEALPFFDRSRGEASLALPLAAPIHVRGALVVHARDRDSAVTAAQRPLVEAVAALAATVIERIHFVAVAHDAQLDAESERLRASILSAVSHDLRTPLTVLVGLSDALAQSSASDPAALAKAAGDIRDEALRMARLVEDLLDMARLQAGRVALRKAWQPIEDVVATSVAAVEGPHAVRHVAIDVPAELPLVEFDAVLIERVIVNLLENAFRHAPDAQVAIRVRAAGESVRIDVEDSGPGIPPGDEERIFHAFGSARPGPHRGAGLGLAICRAIVAAHGGTIGAANRVDGGARFHFTLPSGKPPALAHAVPGAPEESCR